MTFQLQTLKPLRFSGAARAYLKDSGFDDFENYDPGPDEIVDPEVFAEDSDEFGDDPDTGTFDSSGEAESFDEEQPMTDEGQEDGYATENEDGSFSFTDAEGNEYFEDAEGNTMVTYPDGGGIAYLSDGSTFEWDSEGNEVVKEDSEGNTPVGMPSESDASKGEKSTPQAKAKALAQGAINAANKIANGSQAKPKTTPAVLKKTALPSGILKASTATSSNMLAGLGIGSILALGAVGLVLYNITKKGK